jgi:leucine-rich repeat protein SHOC2
MKQIELEQIIEKARLKRSITLNLSNRNLKILPESIGILSDLKDLYLEGNQLTSLPDSICKLQNLQYLYLSRNYLNNLPQNIISLSNLLYLDLSFNKLNNLPKNIEKLSKIIGLDLRSNNISELPISLSKLDKLQSLYLSNNPLSDLSILNILDRLEHVSFPEGELPRRYWTKFSEWKPEWLLNENNTEIRRILISQVGYEKICKELNATNLDIWREYTLLRIDRLQPIYLDEGFAPSDREPMVLLKMTCPSTQHIHILRVPPEMESAEAAITWVNHGIHPDEFAVQT